jgi:hypothetical protein
MTKKLEKLLNLPENLDIVTPEPAKAEPKKSPALNVRDVSDFDKITAALPAVEGLGYLADQELNDIAERAMQAYEDLMDLGMNVEGRFSGRIFEVANTFLRTGMDAKIAKLDKKLKMVDLQLKKEKLDKEATKPSDDITNGEGFVVTDRNSLFDRLKNPNKDK